jgi:hypothetical protein
VDEGDELGLARDAGLGEDTAQMRFRRRLGDAQRGSRLDQTHAMQQLLQHACLRRREPEGGGHRVNHPSRRYRSLFHDLPASQVSNGRGH